LTQVQVLRLADYGKGEASSRNKQKLLSKRRRGVETDDEKENNNLGVCHNMATNCKKYCLIDVVIYITTI
jgi:hypothetical protein